MLAQKLPKPVTLPAGQPVPLEVAADYLTISSKTIKRKAKDGKATLLRYGRRLFLSYDELMRLAREGL